MNRAERLRTTVAELRVLNPGRIPENLVARVGGIPRVFRPGGWSFSPGLNRISIHPQALDEMDDAVLRRHVLHEIGHAIDGFSRARYVMDRHLGNGEFYRLKEREADAFADSCRVA